MEPACDSETAAEGHSLESLEWTICAGYRTAGSSERLDEKLASKGTSCCSFD